MIKKPPPIILTVHDRDFVDASQCHGPVPPPAIWDQIMGEVWRCPQCGTETERPLSRVQQLFVFFDSLGSISCPTDATEVARTFEAWRNSLEHMKHLPNCDLLAAERLQ